MNEQYGKKYYEVLTKKAFDCDNCDLTKNIFKKLHWSPNYIDTINSFWAVYKHVIKKEYGIIYNTNFKDFLSLLNKFDDYIIVNNSQELQLFSKASHMLGNFMPCPQFFNNCKGSYKNGFNDRIDLILLWLTGNYNKSFQGNYDEYNKKVWKKFFVDNENRFNMNMYYGVDKETGIIWVNKLYHDVISSLEKNDCEEAIIKINNLIKMRGLIILARLNPNVVNQCQNLIAKILLNQ